MNKLMGPISSFGTKGSLFSICSFEVETDTLFVMRNVDISFMRYIQQHLQRITSLVCIHSVNINPQVLCSLINIVTNINFDRVAPIQLVPKETSWFKHPKNFSISRNNTYLEILDYRDYSISFGCAYSILKYYGVEGRISFNTFSKIVKFSMYCYLFLIGSDDFMLIDMSSLRNLEIFSNPMFSQICSNNPNSLFGICLSFLFFDMFNIPITSGGSKVFKNWFNFPLSNISLIANRLEHIENIHSLSLEDRSSICTELSIIKHIQFNDITFYDLQCVSNFYIFALSVLNICTVLSKAKEEASFCSIIEHQSFLSHSIEKIYTVFIVNESDIRNQKKDLLLTIKPGYSSDFDYYRDIYSELAELLNDEAIAFCQDNNQSVYPDKKSISTLLDNCSVTCVYFPHLGFLLNIKDNGETENSITNDTFELLVNILKLEIIFISTTSGLYCKSARMLHLDDVYGDIHLKIKDLEIDICHNLITTFFPLEIRRKFVQVWNDICYLDAILALSFCIDKFNLTKPLISENNILIIKDGRNLIIEQASLTPYISNTVNINSNDELISVITGANSSGKSIYLKQIGQIVILAHIGSYIPATAGSQIGIVKELFTLSSNGTSIISQNKFIQNLASINSITSYCTHRSLILIDEFGPGTDTIDGLSLFLSLLFYLLELENMPRAFIVTHYHEYIQSAIEDSNIDKINFLKSDIWDTGKITFLFKMVKGISNNSLSINCAKTAGICPSIINRAIHVYDELVKKKPLELLLKANTDELLKNDNGHQLFPTKSILNTFRFWDSKISTVDELKTKISLLLNGKNK